MIRTGYFSIIRVPDVTDTLQIQAILLVVNAHAHVIVNRSALLQNIESLDISVALGNVLNNSVHRQHNFNVLYTNVIMVKDEEELLKRFFDMVSSFSIQILVTWVAAYEYSVFQEKAVEGLEIVYRHETSIKKNYLSINKSFRFGTKRKIYVADGVHLFYLQQSMQPTYKLSCIIKEFLGDDYYKVLEKYEHLHDMRYNIEAMKNDPCDYIAVSLFDLLSMQTLLEIFREIN